LPAPLEATLELLRNADGHDAVARRARLGANAS
jgi:hypothetical protein